MDPLPLGGALSHRAACANARNPVSDTHSRTDSLTGAVRGLATIQRIKLWKDRCSSRHCITFYSDKPSHRKDRRYREYYISDFEEGLRVRDDKHKECRLGVIGRRGSAPNAVRAKVFNISSPSSWGRHKSRSIGSSSDVPQVVPLDIRWLGIRFSCDAGKNTICGLGCPGYRPRLLRDGRAVVLTEIQTTVGLWRDGLAATARIVSSGVPYRCL